MFIFEKSMDYDIESALCVACFFFISRNLIPLL